jgi:hypothetical protein
MEGTEFVPSFLVFAAQLSMPDYLVEDETKMKMILIRGEHDEKSARFVATYFGRLMQFEHISTVGFNPL